MPKIQKKKRVRPPKEATPPDKNKSFVIFLQADSRRPPRPKRPVRWASPPQADKLAARLADARVEEEEEVRSATELTSDSPPRELPPAGVGVGSEKLGPEGLSRAQETAWLPCGPTSGGWARPSTRSRPR